MHPLKGKLSIDVDDQISLGNLASADVDGRAILCAFFEPVGAGGDAPRGTVKNIDTWRGFGGGRIAGLRFVPHNWSGFAGMAGSTAAKECSDYITELEKDGKRRVDAVEWDIETHNLEWQLDFLFGTRLEDDSDSWTKGIRGRGGFAPDPSRPDTLGYRWGRPGVWTMEGRQDTTTSAAAQAAQTGLLVGPQCYNGPMTEAWDLWFEIQTWVLNANPERQHGARIPVASMLPYYDARSIITKEQIDKWIEQGRFPARSIAALPVGANESVLFATSRLA